MRIISLFDTHQRERAVYKFCEKSMKMALRCIGIEQRPPSNSRATAFPAHNECWREKSHKL